MIHRQVLASKNQKAGELGRALGKILVNVGIKHAVNGALFAVSKPSCTNQSLTQFERSAALFASGREIAAYVWSAEQRISISSEVEAVRI